MLLNTEEFTKRIPELMILFERSFKHQVADTFLDWRYLKNPYPDRLVAVHLDQGRIVASYSASPCQVNINGQILATALSNTTMTDPEYMGRGLFPTLAKELYGYMQDKGYSLIWGFPNRLSHRPFVGKLGWSDIYEIPTMQLNLVNYKAQADITLPTDNDFNLDYSQSQHLDGKIHVIKDEQYLRWRYSLNPINSYLNFILADGGIVSSYCVIKRYGNQLDLVDFQAKDVVEGQILLQNAIKIALVHKLEALNCWAPRHHFFHTLCERAGFINRDPVTYLGSMELNRAPLGISTDFTDWYIQMGDSDVY